MFLYGSMVWGIFPDIYKNVSWESHMLGFFSGLILALWYRKEGTQQPAYEWLNEDEEEENIIDGNEVTRRGERENGGREEDGR